MHVHIHVYMILDIKKLVQNQSMELYTKAIVRSYENNFRYTTRYYGFIIILLSLLCR